MPTLKYKCTLCEDYSCASQHFINHMIRNHPSSFTDITIKNAMTKNHYPVENKNVLIDGYKQYKIYGALCCNKFYNQSSKCEIHLQEKKECAVKHKLKAQELYDRINELKEDNPVVAIAGAGAGVGNTELLTKIKQLEKENQKLKNDNEFLETAREKANLIDDLEWEVERIKLYEYKYERLRYMLLTGLLDTHYGEYIPFLNQHQRMKLVNALESDKILPRHIDGEDWYDEFKCDEKDIEVYKFPIEYKKEETDEEDDY